MKACVRKEENEKFRSFAVELEEALEHNNSAIAWRTARSIARAVKGSLRQFQNAPRTNPSRDESLLSIPSGRREGCWELKRCPLNRFPRWSLISQTAT